MNQLYNHCFILLFQYEYTFFNLTLLCDEINFLRSKAFVTLVRSLVLFDPKQLTGVRTGGAGGPHSEKRGGQHPIWIPPPHFSWFTSLCLALSISIYQLPYLRQHCLGLSMCQRSLRVLKMRSFPHCVRGNPSHTLHSLVYVAPNFKCVASLCNYFYFD